MKFDTILMLGAGGHAKVLIEILKQQKRDIHAIVSPDLHTNCIIFSDYDHITDDLRVLESPKDKTLLINGIGSLPRLHKRAEIFSKFRSAGFEFGRVLSPSASISEFSILEMGVQVLPRALINPDACIGENTIINSGAIIEHDCVVGRDVHVAPSACVCGGVVIGDRTFIGSGATITQGVTIGHDVIVGAGATVTFDLPAETTIRPHELKVTNRSE